MCYACCGPAAHISCGFSLLTSAWRCQTSSETICSAMRLQLPACERFAPDYHMPDYGGAFLHNVVCAVLAQCNLFA
jgi:hypothetical protein